MARVTFYFDVGGPVEYEHVPRETAAEWLDLFGKTALEELAFRLNEETVTAVPRYRLVHVEVDPDVEPVSSEDPAAEEVAVGD